MTHAELATTLAKKLLLKEDRGEHQSIRSLKHLKHYFYEMSMEELLGIATQQGISTF